MSHTNKLQKFDTHNSSSELVAGTNTFHRDVCRYMERTQKDIKKGYGMLWPRNDIEMTWNAPASVGLGIGNGGNTPGIRYGIFVQPRQLPTTNVRPLGRPSQPASRWESPNINRKRQCWRRYDDMMFCTISPGRSH